jgi:TRAP-type C4-dicarboxylate transport system substrate-binding protein
MRLTRRSVVSAALAAPLLPHFAKAAEYSLRLAHTTPLTSPLHIRVAEAAEQIARESNGQVELQVFPDSQLGGDNDLLSQVRSGAVDSASPPARSWQASCR